MRCNFFFRGEQLKAKAALTNKLVHEVAPTEEMIDRAKIWIISKGKAQAPWDMKDFKILQEKFFCNRDDDLACRECNLSS